MNRIGSNFSSEPFNMNMVVNTYTKERTITNTPSAPPGFIASLEVPPGFQSRNVIYVQTIKGITLSPTSARITRSIAFKYSRETLPDPITELIFKPQREETVTYPVFPSQE